MGVSGVRSEILKTGTADPDTLAEEVGALLDGESEAAANQIANGEVIRFL